jgi:two-component system NtrC family sensor kinase
VNFALNTDAKGVKVSADPEQIERVFINLFSNAVDAMAGRGSLNIAVREEKGTARITVSDSGRGIDAEEVEKIFEPFYTTKHKGTGLGLAITFNIVKKHGGEISVESEKGRGTTFVITLPGGKGQQ